MGLGLIHTVFSRKPPKQQNGDRSNYVPGSGSGPLPSDYQGPRGRLKYTGEFLTDQGFGLQGKSLSALDTLDKQLSDEVASGGLPPAVAKAFQVGQGRITDEGTRSRTSFNSNVAEMAARSGGRLDPNAALDYQLENEKNVDESTFTARNDLSSQEALTRMKHTDDLRQMILDIRSKELGAGTATLGLGLQARQGALPGQKGDTVPWGAIASVIAAFA